MQEIICFVEINMDFRKEENGESSQYLIAFFIYLDLRPKMAYMKKLYINIKKINEIYNTNASFVKIFRFFLTQFCHNHLSNTLIDTKQSFQFSAIFRYWRFD